MLTAHADEDGFTLVELLVVMILMGFIGAMVLTTYVTSARTTETATARLDAINDVTPAMQRMTRDLRAAAPLIIDEDGDYTTEVGTEFVRGGETYRTYYYLDPNGGAPRVLSDRYRVDADGNEIELQTSYLVAEVNNEASEPVFTYVDNDGTTITCTADTAECRDKHLTASTIEVFLRRAIGDQSPIEYRTSINIRNTRYS